MAADPAASPLAATLRAFPASTALPRSSLQIVPMAAFAACLCLVGAVMLLDQRLRDAWAAWAGGCQLAYFCAFVLTDYLKIHPVGLTLMLIWRLDRRLPAHFMGTALWVMLSQGCASSLIKTIFGRVRPCNSDGATIFTGLAIHSPDHSFPSGHATGAFALAALLSCFYPRWRLAFLIFAAAVALARVQLDRHFFSDILAGAFLGWFWAKLVMAWRGQVRALKTQQEPPTGQPDLVPAQ